MRLSRIGALHCLIYAAAFTAAAHASSPSSRLPESITPVLEESCVDCHDQKSHKGGLDLTALSKDLLDPSVRERWIRIYDRVEKGEMPPPSEELSTPDRQHLLVLLSNSLTAIDQHEIVSSGRGPLRRLNRLEYERNLRELLHLPYLEIRSMLPEDRESLRFSKTASALDMSRVQLTAYLEAAAAALRQATVSAQAPPPVTHFRAMGTKLFPGKSTFGTEKAMFFAKDNRPAKFPKLAKGEPDISDQDADLEMALFRSATWPYAGNPKGFLAKFAGNTGFVSVLGRWFSSKACSLNRPRSRFP